MEASLVVRSARRAPNAKVPWVVGRVSLPRGFSFSFSCHGSTTGYLIKTVDGGA